jgi:hypothetical protein
LPNKNYIKGYSLERYCVLTLEFNGWHVKRNFRSWGIEDVIATKKGCYPLYVQAKNYKGGLDEEEQFLFKVHAEDYGAIPIYLFVPKRGERVWLDLRDNKPELFMPFTKEWVKERSRIKKILADLKNPKKGGSKKKWKEYVMVNYQEVKQFIC